MFSHVAGHIGRVNICIIHKILKFMIAILLRYLSIIHNSCKYRHSLLCSGVEVRPMIIVLLSNVTTEEHKTVNFECVVMATTLSGWTLFRMVIP